MRNLLVAILIVSLCSCVKEKVAINLSEFINQYLTCDSIEVIEKGNKQTIIKGQGTGLDIRLDSSRAYTIYSVPEVSYRYRIKQTRLYFWPRGTDPHLGDYFEIINKYDNHLLLQHVDFATGVKTLYYYTAD